jgi:hypothetical protein
MAITYHKRVRTIWRHIFWMVLSRMPFNWAD